MREAVKKVVAAFPEHPEDQTQSFQASFNKGTVFFFFFLHVQKAIGQELLGVLCLLQK